MSYIISSGITSDGIILNNDSMTVLNGGIANNTTVNSRGSVYISSGGTADNTILSGLLYVSSGGTAINTTLYYNYNHTPAPSMGMFVFSGGIAINTIICSLGWLNVLSGGTANSVTISAGGRLYVSSGGTATITFNPWARSQSFTSFGGATVTFLDRDANVYYGERGSFVSKADVMNQKIITSGNSLIVYSNGTANNTTLDSYGFLQVYFGGTAKDLTWTPCNGTLLIEDGAIVTFANTFEGVYYGGGGMLTSQAKTLANIEIQSRQEMYVMSNGLANSTSVSSDGCMSVSCGGTANNTTVYSNGALRVASGGTAANIVADSGAILDLSVVPNTYIEGRFADSAFEIQNGMATYYSVNSGNVLRISSGGTANRTVVYSGGNLFVYNGGIASRTTGSNGTMNVRGGLVESTIINSGVLNISSGGLASTTTVNTNGNMYISNGGIARSIVMNSGALCVSSGGIADAVTVNNNCLVYVCSGGTATTISASSMRLRCDVALNTHIAGTIAGSNFVIKDGFTSGYTINQSSWLYVWSGGTARDVTVNQEGLMNVLFGGYAVNTTIKGLHSTPYLSPDYGSMCVFDGGRADNTLVNSFSILSVSAGGIVSSTTINSAGSVLISGTASETTVNQGGSMWVSSGGIASDVRINSGGAISLQQGKITGKVTIEDGGVIHAGQGAVVDFDISQLVPGIGGPRVNNLSLVKDNAPAFTLTVSDLQWNGTYVLAKGAAEFDNLISVKSLTNETIHMVAVDDTVNVGGVEYTLTLTGDVLTVTVVGGKDIPIIPVSAEKTITNQLVTLTAGFSDNAIMREYSFDNEIWHVYTEPLKCSENGTVYFLGKDQRGYVNEIARYEVTNIGITTPTNLVGTADGVSWDSIGANYYLLEYSTDDFAHVLVMATPGTAVDTLNLPGGTYQWRVKADDSGDWAVGEPITSENDPGTAKVLQADGDGNYDLFFANPCGTWETGYFAQHVGSVEEDWGGTQEYAAISGKNKLADFFVGSDDLSILQLTDDANGDALFVDDIYTELPGTLEEQQARIAQISEIRGGGGDDIIDMTSQRFEYIGDGISLHGGDDNDVLWANKGDNWLFGDLGNDRLVGASGDDLIVGGAGDDRMHGGGGDDVFTFCENWGKDTVEHLATGTVTLWFASGDVSNWKEAELTYTDGENSVTVKGVTADQIELKFGDDGTEMFAWLAGLDAFEAYSSRKIFEEPATGILAGPQ